MAKYYWGKRFDKVDTYAWYRANVNKMAPKPVGKKISNSWGLYDMLGNVWEWCLDHYSGNYKETPIDGSAMFITKSKRRSYRGASFRHYPQGVRCAARAGKEEDTIADNLGFRLARKFK